MALRALHARIFKMQDTEHQRNKYKEVENT